MHCDDAGSAPVPRERDRKREWRQRTATRCKQWSGNARRCARAQYVAGEGLVRGRKRRSGRYVDGRRLQIARGIEFRRGSGGRTEHAMVCGCVLFVRRRMIKLDPFHAGGRADLYPSFARTRYGPGDRRPYHLQQQCMEHDRGKESSGKSAEEHGRRGYHEAAPRLAIHYAASFASVEKSAFRPPRQFFAVKSGRICCLNPSATLRNYCLESLGDTALARGGSWYCKITNKLALPGKVVCYIAEKVAGKSLKFRPNDLMPN